MGFCGWIYSFYFFTFYINYVHEYELHKKHTYSLSAMPTIRKSVLDEIQSYTFNFIQRIYIPNKMYILYTLISISTNGMLCGFWNTDIVLLTQIIGCKIDQTLIFKHCLYPWPFANWQTIFKQAFVCVLHAQPYQTETIWFSANKTRCILRSFYSSVKYVTFHAETIFRKKKIEKILKNGLSLRTKNEKNSKIFIRSE